MMGFLQKLNPVWMLRLALGLMYIYSGYDLFSNPRHWYGFVPPWLSRGFASIGPIDVYLKLQGTVELLLGLLFLAWFSGKMGMRIAAILATTEMVLILIFVGIDPITFRDIGLLGAALAFFILSFKPNGTIQPN